MQGATISGRDRRRWTAAPRRVWVDHHNDEDCCRVASVRGHCQHLVTGPTTYDDVAPGDDAAPAAYLSPARYRVDSPISSVATRLQPNGRDRRRDR